MAGRRNSVDEAYNYRLPHPDPKAYAMVDMVKKILYQRNRQRRPSPKVHGFARTSGAGYMIAKPELLELNLPSLQRAAVL